MARLLRSFQSLSLLVVLLPMSVAYAQFGPDIKGPEEYVSWSSRPVPSNIGAGGTSVIKLTATVADDWKMYALDSSLPSLEDVLTRPVGVTMSMPDSISGIEWSGQIGQAGPKKGRDPIFEMDLLWFYGEATFYTAVTSTDSLTATVDIPLDVRFQLCNDEIGVCLRPTIMEVHTSLSIDPTCIACTAAPEDIARTRQVSLVASPSDYDTYRSGGLLPFLLLAIGAGLASLLTPCVFPMIPLTVSYFTKQGHSRSRAVKLAIVYGLSIVATFTAIGIAMAVLVGAAGAQSIAANPWVNLFIAFVLVGFALSLLGLYEIRVPSSILTWVNARGGEEQGWAGVLFMGLTLTLVSFSCTAPFVGGLLAAASMGTWIYPLLGMMVYSATFALPFLLLALFPKALDRLPKSGTWMNSMKVVLGFVELAAAVKFLSNADLVWRLGVLPRTLGVALVVLFFLLAGAYLWGWLRLDGDGPQQRPGPARRVLAVGIFGLAIWMMPGLIGKSLGSLDAYLPPRQAADTRFLTMLGVDAADENHDEGWFVDDIEGAFAEADRRGIPVMVDFSGWTCTNCRDMEANVFPEPEVKRRLTESFVPLRLYTDDLEKGDGFHAFQMALTGTPALPTYAIARPSDRQLIARQSALMSISEFIDFLDDATVSWKDYSQDGRQ